MHKTLIPLAALALSSTLAFAAKDEASKPEQLGKATAALPSGEWHRMLVEVKGEQVEVQTDDGAKVEVQNAALAVDKTGYRFVMKGASLLLDDVRVWKVAP